MIGKEGKKKKKEKNWTDSNKLSFYVEGLMIQYRQAQSFQRSKTTGLGEEKIKGGEKKKVVANAISHSRKCTLNLKRRVTSEWHPKEERDAGTGTHACARSV